MTIVRVTYLMNLKHTELVALIRAA
jgi:hypothetical protein